MAAMRLLSRTAVVLFVLLSAARPAADQQKKKEIPLRPIAPLDLRRTLDLYAEGRFDEAVQAVARAGDETGRNLRRHWAVTGQAWIDASPGNGSRRLVAAALALETENIRVERGDWRITDDPPCAGACVLDWAHQQLVARGTPDRAEHAWYLAAAALVGGVRDWRYLQRPADPRFRGAVAGLIDRALVRFPSDAALRLEEALAAASRFNLTAEDGTPPPTIQLPPTIPPWVRDRILGPGGRGDARVAADLLGALREDPDLGAEARTRLGYLYWTQGNHEGSRAELTAAASRARDPESRYLANFLLGWTEASRGDMARAIPHLEAALEARPGSQSAAVLLAALELHRGDAAKADAIARASLERPDLDPWRLFLYGHHPRLPERIAALRRELTP